jgi:hypothetical protein
VRPLHDVESQVPFLGPILKVWLFLWLFVKHLAIY